MVKELEFINNTPIEIEAPKLVGIIEKIEIPEEKKELPQIAFSYPYGNGFEPEWVESVIGLLLHECSKPKEERVLGSIIKFGSCYVDTNRSIIGKELVNRYPDDWVVMVDPDIGFKSDLFEQFAKHINQNPDAKVIAGRVDLLNGLPVFYKTTMRGMIHQPFPFEGLREFDLVGTGIICIAKEVFVNIFKTDGHPFFFNKIITSEKMLIGDDFSFCMRAKRAGYKIYGAWDIYGQHYRDSVPVPKRYLELSDLEVKK